MTIKDIATAAGVSTSTVSKVINQKDANISEETRQRVLQVIEESNYIPYAGVRDRLLARNNQIALVVPSLRDSFYTDFADKLQISARSRGFSVSIHVTSHSQELETQILHELSEGHIAGLLYYPQTEEGIRFLQSAECNIRNAVLMDSDLQNCIFPQLSKDYRGLADSAALYLIRHNHHRIALVLSVDSPLWIRQSLTESYRAALSSGGCVLDPNLIISDGHPREADIEHLIDSGIDSVICQDSLITGEVYRILSRKGYRVPDDISVLCLQDNTLLTQMTPNVSAYSTDSDEMVRLALDSLLSQISSGQVPVFKNQLSYSFVRRDSVKKHGTPKHKIVIVGSINMDITLKVSRLPHSGETVLASALSSWPGGKGANQAIGVSRFGADAFMIGRLGNDLYGKQLFERLSRESVDMKGVSFSHDLLSGTAYINVQKDGQNTIVVNPGANASVTPEYIEKNRTIFEHAQYCLVQMEIPLSSIEKIIQICKDLHIKVILKPSPVQALSSSILDSLFLLIPNQEEMDELCPNLSSPEDQARFYLGKGVQNVIITLGDRGCIFAAGEVCKAYPAISFPSVDATGASDVFISCLASQLARGQDMDCAIRLATLAASYSVSKEGVQNAIINSDLLFDLFQGNYSLSANSPTMIL